MKQEELQEVLAEAIRTEETASAIYLGHLKVITSRSGLSQPQVQKITELIQYLVRSNQEHKKALEILSERIRKGEIDVF